MVDREAGNVTAKTRSATRSEQPLGKRLDRGGLTAPADPYEYGPVPEHEYVAALDSRTVVEPVAPERRLGMDE